MLRKLLNRLAMYIDIIPLFMFLGIYSLFINSQKLYIRRSFQKTIDPILSHIRDAGTIRINLETY